jgi:4-amino-4-deoxy-L-arabinose transferase-like glycosyltransferase
MRGRVAISHWILLCMAVLVGSLVLSGAYPLVDPDEGRNAEVAREMSASGDFLVPRLAGMPYLDKPPALFWAETLAFRVLGATPRAARLPSVVSAWAILLIVGSVAARRVGERFALVVVAMLASAPLFAVLSAYVIFDMPLALCVTIVWAGIVEEMAEGPARKWRIAMFAATTLGVLLKGPIMLAWALGGSLGAALLARGRGPLRWLSWWPGWIFLFAVAGGWFALATRRYPEYPHYAFLEESLERLTTGNFHRQQPPWFVPVVLVFGALPASLATPWAARVTTQAGRVALGFLLFAIVFFSVSSSKLVTYLLPAFPMMAWLGAEAWCDAGRERRGAIGVALVFGALAVLCGGASLRPDWLGFLGDAKLIPLGRSTAGQLALVWTAIAIIAFLAAWRSWRNVPWIACFSFMPILLVQAGPVFQAYASSQSGEPLARALASYDRVRFEHCYSPGADFIRGRRSELVSLTGLETTSNYQARYRETLKRRGEWTPLASVAGTDSSWIVVRPPGGVNTRAREIFRDQHFVANAP